MILVMHLLPDLLFYERNRVLKQQSVSLVSLVFNSLLLLIYLYLGMPDLFLFPLFLLVYHPFPVFVIVTAVLIHLLQDLFRLQLSALILLLHLIVLVVHCVAVNFVFIILMRLHRLLCDLQYILV